MHRNGWGSLLRRAAPILIARWRVPLVMAGVVGVVLALAPLTADGPDEDDEWALIYRDTFDREAPPVVERTGAGVEAGARALWQRSIDEGVTDEGRATFSRFTLVWEGTARLGAYVPASTTPDDRLVKLRAWRGDAMYDAIAQAHAALLRQSGCAGPSEAERILEVAGESSSAEDFIDRLRELE